VAVVTSELQRRLFPVYFLVDASGSMSENGKWKVAHELVMQCVQHFKDSPDPDFETFVQLLVLKDSNLVMRYVEEQITQLDPHELQDGGHSGYAIGIERVTEILEESQLPQNAHPPCLVLVGDGHVDASFEYVLENSLKSKSFLRTTRIVVKIGNDFETEPIRKFLSVSSNFFTVMDFATMPFFYMRLASLINSQASQSRSRRIISG
jgi:uncharacterized protein YegL